MAITIREGWWAGRWLVTLLPVVGRELRVASRRGSTYWGRAGAALVAMVIGAWFFWTFSRFGSVNSIGRELFGTIAVCLYGYALLAGVTYSSDSVTVEKREGTLGLLFLTDLRGYDVVGGKLTASSLGVFYRLVAVLPILAIALLMGGVTAGEYWRMVIVLLTTLFASLAVGMFASTVCLNSRRAAGLTITILVLVWSAAPLMKWIGTSGLGIRLPDWLPYLTPGYGLIGAEDAEYRQISRGTLGMGSLAAPKVTKVALFWTAVGLTIGLGIGALITAALILPRAWQQDGTERGRRGVAAAFENVWLRGEVGKRRLRTALLEANPILWLNAREAGKHFWVWAVLALGAFLFLLFAWKNGRSWWDSATYLATSIVVHAVLKFWIASEAPRRLTQDRRNGAMELYLCTSLDVREIIGGQFQALRRQFLGPVIAVLAVDVLFVVASDSQFDKDRNSWVFLWIVRMLFLGLDFAAMGWVGMWIGMIGRGSRGTGSVLFRVLGIPWIISLILLTGLLTLSWLNPAAGTLSDPIVLMATWFLVGSVNDGVWIAFCRGSLQSRFRQMATIQPGQRRGWRWGFWKKRG